MWNRPNENKAEVVKRDGQSKAHLKAIFAGLIVVCLGAAVAWWIVGSEPTPVRAGKDGKASKRIKEVKPARAQLATKPEPKQNPDVDKDGRPTKIGQIINGWVKLPSGRMHKVYGVHTAKVARVSLIERTFENPVDQDLAQLTTLEPGSEVVGDSSDYYENYKEQFLESCKTPVIIESDDSEEVKLLKQMVIDTRKELSDALSRGEDLTKIMRESREQLRELGLYKDELHRQIDKILEDGGELSENDIKDLRDAANLMLEERGIPPLHLDAAVIYQARKQRLEEQEAQK